MRFCWPPTLSSESSFQSNPHRIINIETIAMVIFTVITAAKAMVTQSCPSQGYHRHCDMCFVIVIDLLFKVLRYVSKYLELESNLVEACTKPVCIYA